MTKVLVITNKSDLTSDFVIKKLRDRHVDFYRLNTEELFKSIFVTLDFKNKSFKLFDKNLNAFFDLTHFSSVYFRRPELPDLNLSDLSIGESGFVRNEVIYVLEGIYKILRNCYWISSVYSIREAENKIHQLIVADEIGFTFPNSIITNSWEDGNYFFNDNKKECIIKPIKSGLIEDSNNSKVIFTTKIDSFPEDKERIEACPIFLQNHIKKNADIRVTVVGSKVFSTLIASQANETTKTDWRKGEIVLEHSKIELPKEIETKCIQLLKLLDLKFGAIDFILDELDNYIFLEINPNGQWAWIELQTGYEISDEIVNLLLHENF